MWIAIIIFIVLLGVASINTEEDREFSKKWREEERKRFWEDERIAREARRQDFQTHLNFIRREAEERIKNKR